MKVKKQDALYIILLLTLIAFLIFFLIKYYSLTKIDSWTSLCFPSFCSIVISFVLLLRNNNIKKLSNTNLYFIYSVLSLFGLVLLLPFFPELRNMRSEYTMSFLNSNLLKKAILISIIGLIVYVLSTIFFVKLKNKKNKLDEQETNNTEMTIENSCNKKIAGFFTLILIISLFYFSYYIIAHYNYIFNYSIRVTVSNSIFNYFTIIMALSFVLIISFGNKNQIIKGIIIFGLCAIINFLLGNRGEIYYPIFAGIAVYSKRNGKFNKKIVFLGLISSLLLISFVRVYRNHDFSINTIANSFSPTTSISESIGEMGFQIAPFTYMLEYLENTKNFQHGKTFVYSIKVFLSRHIPLIRPPVDNSPESIVGIMPASGFGFTNLGEFYYNFGLIGVILFSVAISKYLVDFSKIKGKYLTIFNDLFFVEIIALVRNSSSTLPVYFAWCLVFTGLVYLYSSFVKTKEKTHER